MDKDKKYVEDLKSQLAGTEAVQEPDWGHIYTMMQSKAINGYQIGRLASDLHEHRPTEKNIHEEDVLTAQKKTKMLYDATPDRVTLSLVDRKPSEDGALNTHARINFERDKDGWKVANFFTGLDPSGAEGLKSQGYVDLADGINTSYKGGAATKFATEVVRNLSKGQDLWESMFNADHMGRIDNVFDQARKQEQAKIQAGDKPTALIKIREGAVAGRFESVVGSAAERRTATAPQPIRNER